ncbi:monocarboxylate permease, putative [Talaromyces stipitatus ATCC 10500]|uniref:Monocarboxylate permease, putative n=1 Tax=Talaromyces stipitatus (strain ATCC 10500 / CBS 375.48 / QM 6759 / NRRL 1006) TaxID=441959 RepID=B8MU88_TALSN|nr:monocarboxylate permease, putative [Talaromyces stipitatus ATCC 10500]EED11592.1 monocarboxylate permease, putative [Talaromyces stipitatus ATCC 10500]
MDPNIAQYLLAMLNAGSLFGRLIAGALADTLGAYNIFTFVCYLSGILVLALWIPGTGNAAVIAFAVIFGFTSGAYASLIANLIVKISPNFKVIGYRTGLAFLFGSIGGLTTNPIAGAILQNSNGSYVGMKIFSGVFIMSGTTLVFAARLHRTGPKLVGKF